MNKPTPKCPECNSDKVTIDKYGKYVCGNCGHQWRDFEVKQKAQIINNGVAPLTTVSKVQVENDEQSREQEESEFDGILGMGDEDALFPPTF